jgi:hypothetical protein
VTAPLATLELLLWLAAIAALGYGLIQVLNHWPRWKRMAGEWLQRSIR